MRASGVSHRSPRIAGGVHHRLSGPVLAVFTPPDALVDSGGTSQHLAALKRHGLLESRRERTSVYYRVRDPRLFQLLEVARQILTSNLADATSLLRELERT